MVHAHCTALHRTVRSHAHCCTHTHTHTLTAHCVLCVYTARTLHVHCMLWYADAQGARPDSLAQAAQAPHPLAASPGTHPCQNKVGCVPPGRYFGQDRILLRPTPRPRPRPRPRPLHPRQIRMPLAAPSSSQPRPASGQSAAPLGPRCPAIGHIMIGHGFGSGTHAVRVPVSSPNLGPNPNLALA